MFSKSKVKKVDFVTLSKFYGKYKEALQLELINSPAGLSRHICEPALNRPGLAIAGFYSYFANKRIQVFGSAELAYLQKTAGRHAQISHSAHVPVRGAGHRLLP